MKVMKLEDLDASTGGIAIANAKQFRNKVEALTATTLPTALLIPLYVEVAEDLPVQVCYFKVTAATGERTVSRKLVQLGPTPV